MRAPCWPKALSKWCRPTRGSSKCTSGGEHVPGTTEFPSPRPSPARGEGARWRGDGQNPLPLRERVASRNEPGEGSPRPGRSMLSVERVDLFYSASQALRGVSLTAAKGAVTCVMGRNGVGKTSLMRAIVGQQPIRSGRIVWEDEDITRLPSYQRAARGIA